jgi:hypothetical protein
MLRRPLGYKEKDSSKACELMGNLPYFMFYNEAIILEQLLKFQINSQTLQHDNPLAFFLMSITRPSRQRKMGDLMSVPFIFYACIKEILENVPNQEHYPFCPEYRPSRIISFFFDRFSSQRISYKY